MLNTNNIPIFDSLTHPMPNANWLNGSYDGKNSLNSLISGMEINNVAWALAVGMGKDIGGYQEESYVDFIRQSERLFPVAYVDVSEFRDLKLGELQKKLKVIEALGYVGIKLHPRLSNFCVDEPVVEKIIQSAAEISLGVLLCTYCWGGGVASRNTPDKVMELLDKVTGNKVILVHAGAVRLIEYVEIARAFDNVLLDLSLTLCKYPGSALDMDIRFAFNNFDKRICIGSDSPEFCPSELRCRFNYFSEGVAENKLRNIAYKNLSTFLPKVPDF